MASHRSWLILAGAYLKPVDIEALTARFGSLDDVVRASDASLAGVGLDARRVKSIRQPDAAAVDAALAWLDASPAHQLVTYGSDDYPELLGQIPDPPALLYVNGRIDALHLPSIALVGSRNPTRGGLRNAGDFAAHLGDMGFSIVSGLAQGIDTAAHTGALEASAGTVAFLGHGIDRVYPASNRELAHRIAAQGALATEYPPGAPPSKEHFPRRNRLISGISLGTLVIEAARRSGSLITARLASEQGREVFALPGSIHNPLARGCHRLIRQGAKLVETAEDIVAELAPLTGHIQQNIEESVQKGRPADTDDGEYESLRKLLGHDPISIDELARESGLTIDTLSSMLLILELEGEVEALSGGRYSLIS